MASDSAPLLSLVIPTRERASTLRYALATALDQRSHAFEVVVSDNASSDGTHSVVQEFDDPRVRYFNTGNRLSMCDNYEFALERARGTYVVIIGDDDAVLPGALDMLLSLLDSEQEPIIHMWPLNVYDWPHNGCSAKVAYLAPMRPPSEMNLKAKARFVVSVGGWKYYELPSPYHCAVPRCILSAIRERTGRVFHSTQPDVFTAMAIPAFADRAVNVGQPVTLHGRSSKSNGLGFVTRSAMTNIERFINEYGDYPFHETLYPGVAGAANMIPDAVLKASDLFPEVYAGHPFNYSAMWAYVCRLRFASHAMVLRHTGSIRKHHAFGVMEFLLFSLVHEVSAVRRRVLDLVTLSAPSERHAPNNIQEFARTLARADKPAT